MTPTRLVIATAWIVALACGGAAPDLQAPEPASAEGPPVVEAPSDLPPVDIDHYSPDPLDPAALQTKTLRELSLMRNTIYARVGNPFAKGWLKTYFEDQPWYVPGDRADLQRLTAVDRQNAARIAEAESNRSREALLRSKTELLDVWNEEGDHFCCDAALELQLVSAALGEWLGDPETPKSERNPLEDPTVFDGTLSEAQIADLSRRDLRLARNTIFARHGRAFRSDLLTEFFDQKVWYVVDPTYADARLTDTDRVNLDILSAREAALGGAMTDDEHQEEMFMMVGA